MRILSAAAGALAVSAALAQAGSPQGRRARGGADAGPSRVRTPGPVLLGVDPPGKLRPSPASDAGPVAQEDAGPDDVHRELLQLRARVDALERERAQSAQQSQQLGEVVRQLQELRAQVSAAEQRRQAVDERQAARSAEVQSGVSALQEAQALLAGGDSSVDGQLAQAQAAFPPQAQRDVEAARTALRNRDLSAARAYLSAAIADAQQGR